MEERRAERARLRGERQPTAPTAPAVARVANPTCVASPSAFHALLEHYLPGGQVESGEYAAPNPRLPDAPGKLKVNLGTGAWCHFAAGVGQGHGGSDPHSLVRYLIGPLFDPEAFDAAESALNAALAADEANGRGLVPAPEPEPLVPVPSDCFPPLDAYLHPTLGKPTMGPWHYRNPARELLGGVGRWDLPGGKKIILPLRWSHEREKWYPGGFPYPRPLYGLARLAERPDAPVIVTEGEKAADAAQGHYPHCVAVTSPGGCKAAREADWTPLQGRVVYISPDNDPGGADYAKAVAAKLGGVARAVVILPPVGGDGGDLADLAAGDAPPLPEIAGLPAEPAASGGVVLPAESDVLVMGPRGQPKWCAENARIVLTTGVDWRGVLAFNEFTQQTMLLRPVPGSRTPRSTFKPRELQDADIARALAWFNRNRYPDATMNVLHSVMEMVARESIVSPVRHYLEDLQHDGVPRLDTWLPRYFGADDTPYVRAVGRAWLISAVARAMVPGRKADHMLVLEGPQGIGKSSALRALAGDDWFYDGLPDMHSKDASQSLRGKWIIEIAELSAMRRSDVETVKSFLTRNEEWYRPPYGRTAVREPRRCVFAGTVNPGVTGYLRDDTGNRRFWPVKVTCADRKALAEDRDQLWAEAVAAFRAGEPWWLSHDMERVAGEEQSKRQDEDAWTGRVLGIAEALPAVSTRHVIVLMFGSGDPEKQTKPNMMRVAGILRRNGWEADGQFTERGADRGLTRFVRQNRVTEPPRLIAPPGDMAEPAEPFS